MNLKNIEKVHIIGIEGAGTSALARILKAQNIEISGSDEGDHFYFDMLKDEGIKVFHKFSSDNIPTKLDLIIYSTAFNEKTNIELATAIKSKTKTISYPEALSILFQNKFGISVCGTHGKTTTTAWLGYVLSEAGICPNVLVGSKVGQFDGNVLIGKSDYFVVESDEYQNKLKYYNPRAVLLNNIEYDHPDFFKNKEEYLDAFIEFIKKIPKKGFLVANFDDKNIRKIAQVDCHGRVVGYAIEEAADYVAYNIIVKAGRQSFKVKLNADFDDESGDLSATELGEFSISLMGRHNVYNALAVIATAIELGLELSVIRTHLETFTGTARRMQEMGKYRGAILVDDYAHHPTEIKASLDGIKQKYPSKNIITVFQPHTFTRTKALFDNFVTAFGNTDELILLDIYGSAREEQGGVHSKDIVVQLKIKNEKLRINYISTVDKATEYLRGEVSSNDVVVFMGAGDVYNIGEDLLE
ncbi:MAG: UDP-N-acetylmuramate--L-alanine ligase [Patescibacteria group bacterium]|nr:UDP-N-acetylmuramate--L-alanine ligase [Patescibacteria group bacterium]